MVGEWLGSGGLFVVASTRGRQGLRHRFFSAATGPRVSGSYKYSPAHTQWVLFSDRQAAQ